MRKFDQFHKKNQSGRFHIIHSYKGKGDTFLLVLHIVKTITNSERYEYWKAIIEQMNN